MRSRIWVEKNHHHIMLSRFGFSLLLTGLVDGSGAAFKDISLSLRQGTIRFSPKFVSIRTGLLNPGLATQALGGFFKSVDQGFAISVTFPPDKRILPGLASLEATIQWSDGSRDSLRLATIMIQVINPIVFEAPTSVDTVGIALATYNPNPALFARQIDSIRRQSHRDWICVVSDDCSSPTFLGEVQAVLKDDPRFRLAIGTNNAGIYRNFERAITLLPETCRWIAFADQDDEWSPNKLEALLTEGTRTQSPIVFSDMAIYSIGGQRLADTFWTFRRLEFQSPAAIAIANTVTGMAMLFRSCILATAMPFPALPGLSYHDRWITLVGLAKGNVQYVSQKLVRYIQHGGNHTGVLKRPISAKALLFQFVRCYAGLSMAALRPSWRSTIPDRLKLIDHWSNVELLSLSLQIEALQQRLPRGQWRDDTWDQFKSISSHPASAIFHIPIKSLRDPYRRSMLMGLAVGTLSKFLISVVLKGTRVLSRNSA
jgi:glycosyltransferase involved in cell wall biosynthesis